jgi:hypothetical protein
MVLMMIIKKVQLSVSNITDNLLMVLSIHDLTVVMEC